MKNFKSDHVFDQNLIQLPFVIQLNSNQIVSNVYFNKQEASGSILIKKSVAELFNINYLETKREVIKKALEFVTTE